jgi:hypothetical protein
VIEVWNEYLASHTVFAGPLGQTNCPLGIAWSYETGIVQIFDHGLARLQGVAQILAPHRPSNCNKRDLPVVRSHPSALN